MRGAAVLHHRQVERVAVWAPAPPVSRSHGHLRRAPVRARVVWVVRQDHFVHTPVQIQDLELYFAPWQMLSGGRTSTRSAAGCAGASICTVFVAASALRRLPLRPALSLLSAPDVCWSLFFIHRAAKAIQKPGQRTRSASCKLLIRLWFFRRLRSE